MQTSARRGISYPSADRSDRPDIPAHFANLIAALELDPSINVGAAGSRPANPGYPRYFYWATDTHVMSFWDGTSWYNVGSVDLIPQTLIDAKGDLIAGLSDNVAGRVALGSQGYVLSVDTAQASGLKWILNSVVDLIAAKGDLVAGTGADALSRVAVGTNGQTLLADSAQAAGVKWGAPTLPFSQNVLGADVTITTANTFYDGPAVTVGAGIWKLEGVVCVFKSGSAIITTAKLWDGTTVLASAIGKGDGNGAISLPVSAIVTAGGTTTYKISATSDANTSLIKAAVPVNGTGNNASWLSAVQIG